MRYLKNGAANAIRTLRAADAAPTDRVIGLSPLQIQRRFTAAARAAGIEARVTAHSGRVGLASELTARGASTTEVMLAGNSARMVAHYSARHRRTRGRQKVSVGRGLREAEARRMTDTPRRWDRLPAESDPAFEAFAAYLDTGSLRDAYRQRSGKAQATAAPGAWTGWSAKYNWVSRRAAYVEFTVRECQDAIQIGLVQIRKRLIDAANELLDNGGVPAVRAASRVIVENFPPVARVADVSDGEQIEDLSDIPDADLERMRAIRDAARAKNEQINLEE